MILVVDDDNAIRVSLSMLLRSEGYEVKTAASPAEAVAVVRGVKPELVLLDMNFSHSTSGDEGLTLLRQIKVFQPETPVILMTAWGSIPLAVEGIKAGATDFITKPWDNRLLSQRVETVMTLSGCGRGDAKGFDRSRIIGDSPAIRNVLDTVERIAPTNAPVLIMGENGTGKELVAEAIHINSRRCDHPFVKVNLGGISRSLFECEMFGHKKGAFTGAMADREGRFSLADKGTIFLDEIGELDLNSQVKLLRVLQEHTFEVLGDSRPKRVDIRVVCATNADLGEMVAEGTFREDLFYRINLITVTLPPLHDRPADIPALVHHFAAGFCKENGMRVPRISRGALSYLARLPYPGNIRELRNLVERALLLGNGDTLDECDFSNAASLSTANMPQLPSDASLGEIEVTAIKAALSRFEGNVSMAAACLGISRQALYRRMKKYGIGI